jgi:hypothetical protein
MLADKTNGNIQTASKLEMEYLQDRVKGELAYDSVSITY